MKGLQFFKGNITIENNDLVMETVIDLLKYEVENFCYSDPTSCNWDANRGLDRKIIFSNNKEAISSEVRNKIITYFSERVIEVYNIVVEIVGGSIKVSCEMSTIYGTTTFTTEGG